MSKRPMVTVSGLNLFPDGAELEIVGYEGNARAATLDVQFRQRMAEDEASEIEGEAITAARGLMVAIQTAAGDIALGSHLMVAEKLMAMMSLLQPESGRSLAEWMRAAADRVRDSGRAGPLLNVLASIDPRGGGCRAAFDACFPGWGRRSGGAACDGGAS